MQKYIIKIFLCSLIIGVLNESINYLMVFWLYHPWWITFVNFIIMFGLIMPLVAISLYKRSNYLIFAGGFTVGFIYEMLDQFVLHWCSFPDHKFLIFTNIFYIRVIMAILWGLVPLVCVLIARRK